jgi:transposase
VSEITRIAIDTSKAFFALHAVDAAGRTVFRRGLRRPQFEAFFEKQAAVEVVLEACGGSHHWGRWLAKLGHRVRLIPPQYVKPFVKRAKNDRNDAEAISVAASQPSIGSVPVKSAKAQAAAMLLSARELLVRQRTQLANALRGHATELGMVAPIGNKGLTCLRGEVATADEALVPPAAKQALKLLGREIDRIEASLVEIDARLKQQFATDTLARKLARVPGIGPITALNLSLRVDAGQFKSGRHFAAWLGLVPRENSTGGKQRLGGISRAGNERLRQLLVVGATAVIQHAKPDRAGASLWLIELLKRRPRKLVAVAWANKMARIVWAMMTSGEEYRPAKAA